MSESDNSHALLQVDNATLDRLQKELLDQNEQMAKRIRTVFTLRNIGGSRVVSILASGMYKLAILPMYQGLYPSITVRR